MDCETFKAQLTWYLYNELDERQRGELEDHVESCAACAAELEKERAFLAALRNRQALEPSAALLAECRHDLMRSVYRDRAQAQKVVAWGRTRGQSWLAFRLSWRPIAVAAMLLVSFAGGWWIHGGPAREPRLLDPSRASIANISGVQLDPAGVVRISFDEIERQTLSGQPQDPNILRFLKYAATDYANPSIRMDTLDILKEQAGDRGIRNTLLHLLSNDVNAGVRLKALESLKQYSRHPEVRQALIGVLTRDGNPGMRVQAIELLMEAQDHNLVGVLQDVAQKEENNYVRMRCRDALRSMNASVETF
jgi:hypothetical protein